MSLSLFHNILCILKNLTIKKNSFPSQGIIILERKRMKKNLPVNCPMLVTVKALDKTIMVCCIHLNDARSWKIFPLHRKHKLFKSLDLYSRESVVHRLFFLSFYLFHHTTCKITLKFFYLLPTFSIEISWIYS